MEVYESSRFDGSVRYNVATWCQDIANIIEINNKKNIYSIIVGGTGMYIDKFLNGLIQVPKISENIKKESDKLILKIGKEKFIKEVKRIDKTSFNKISINDTNRLRRIWEVFHGTKKTLTYWLKNKNKKYLYDQKYNIFLFTPNREEIYKTAQARQDLINRNDFYTDIIGSNIKTIYICSRMVDNIITISCCISCIILRFGRKML